MANFYYVKSGGSATGDAGRVATTRSTGSFATKGASAYYDNIVAALAATTSPVAGDFVFVSDLHSHSYGAADTVYTGPATNGDILYIVSVSDSNLDQYSLGSPLAKESVSDGFDFNWNGTFVLAGLEFETGAVQTMSENSQLRYVDSKMAGPGSQDQPFRIFNDGCAIHLTNTELNYGATDTRIFLNAGVSFDMFGGSVTGAAVAELIVSLSFTSGGAGVRFSGVDLGVVTGDLIPALGTTTDSADIVIDGCKLNSAVTFAAGVFTQPGQKMLVTRSSDDSDIAEHQFFQRTAEGDVEDATNIFRDESQAFPGGDKVSIKALPKSIVDAFNPLTFDLPAQFIQLSSSDKDVLTIHFAVADSVTLTNVNLWAELIYPDGTNKQTPNYLSNQNADPLLAAGTTHTDDSGSSTWKDGASDLTSFNEYRMTLDTSSDAGADSVPVIRIHVGIDADVYFDSEVTLG